jgi:hypothetical protein
MLFPWVGALEQAALADVYVYYDDVLFSKGSFVNRVQIKTADGSRWLTVPVRSPRLGRTISELAIDDTQEWRARHLRQLREAYASAPHVDEMLTLVDRVYTSHTNSLASLVIDAFETVLEYLGLDAGLERMRSSDLSVEGAGSERVLRIVRRLGAREYVTGHGGARYLDHELFEDAGVSVRYMDYERTPYPQQHEGFDPYVSALDLIANVGRDAPRYLRPRTVGWRAFVGADSSDALDAGTGPAPSLPRVTTLRAPDDPEPHRHEKQG